MKPDRLQAFSDGVLAILITILVLEFHIPNFSRGHLINAVILQWPILVAYIVSFLYVGTLWLFHHDFFSQLETIDRNLNLINLIVLFTITLVDYPTNLVATSIASGNTTDMKTAFIIYDIVALLISASFALLYWYVMAHPNLNNSSTTFNNSVKSDPLRSVAIYALAIVVTPFSLIAGAFLLCAGIIFHTFAYVHLSKQI